MTRPILYRDVYHSSPPVWAERREPVAFRRSVFPEEVWQRGRQISDPIIEYIFDAGADSTGRMDTEVFPITMSDLMAAAVRMGAEEELYKAAIQNMLRIMREAFHAYDVLIKFGVEVDPPIRQAAR